MLSLEMRRKDHLALFVQHLHKDLEGLEISQASRRLIRPLVVVRSHLVFNKIDQVVNKLDSQVAGTKTALAES